MGRGLNLRGTIVFYLLGPGKTGQATMRRPLAVAHGGKDILQRRLRRPLLPPPVVVINRAGELGGRGDPLCSHQRQRLPSVHAAVS
jgi:hypothetical protein